MEYAPLTELIGFDVILLGFLTLLVSCVGRELWLSGPSGGLLTLRRGWDNFVGFLGGVVDSDENRIVPASGAEPKSAGQKAVRLVPLIGMIGLAGLLGMIMNILGDTLLDLPTLEISTPVQAEWVLSLEDRLKLKVLESVSKNYDADAATKDSLESLRKHTASVDTAKAFFQHAYARTLRSSDVSSVLRYEFQAVKVLRVLFMETIFLLVAAAVGDVRRRRRAARERQEEKEAKEAGSGDSPGVKVLKPFLLLALLPAVFLLLWYTQVKRYDKRIVHSYFVLNEKSSDAGKNP